MTRARGLTNMEIIWKVSFFSNHKCGNARIFLGGFFFLHIIAQEGPQIEQICVLFACVILLIHNTVCHSYVCDMILCEFILNEQCDLIDYQSCEITHS